MRAQPDDDSIRGDAGRERVGSLSFSTYGAEMSAQLKALVLCDFAQVREGLLFVQSGGLTRLVAPKFPAKFPCRVAALIYSPPDEAGAAHRVVMRVKAASSATVIATINVALHETAPPRGLAPGEGRLVPIVVPLGGVTFPAAGEYDLQVDVDDELAGDLSFRVGQRASPPAT
jgi:Family of unknown function (DUF6941)